MKRIFILIFTELFICSCSNDDDGSNAITGTWKLMESVSYGQGGISSIDYSNKNILYDFRFNGILVVSGGENAGYPDGVMILSKSYVDGPTLKFERK